MEVFRLARKKFAGLTGIGAAQKGGRWNSTGVELIYTAGNRSLAMAEIAVHLTLETLPDDYVMLTIFIPDDILIQQLKIKDLPKDWNSFPHLPSTQSIGDKFVFNKVSCVLKTPSAVTQGDFNYLINPNHSDFKRIKIINKEKFPFDQRIFR